MNRQLDADLPVHLFFHQLLLLLGLFALPLGKVFELIVAARAGRA